MIWLIDWMDGWMNEWRWIKRKREEKGNSKINISINEKERIIDELILNSLEDISNKSEELFKKHMIEFML